MAPLETLPLVVNQWSPSKAHGEMWALAPAPSQVSPMVATTLPSDIVRVGGLRPLLAKSSSVPLRDATPLTAIFLWLTVAGHFASVLTSLVLFLPGAFTPTTTVAVDMF
jgi:hypothetical protein